MRHAGQHSGIAVSAVLAIWVALPQVVHAQDPDRISMRPTVTSSTLGKGDQQLVFWVYPLIDANGVVSECSAVMHHRSVARSGGHDHDDASRPKGGFEPASGQTGSTGYYSTYTAPEIGGTVEYWAVYTCPSRGTLTTSPGFIHVEIPGLVPLPPGNYVPTGAVAGQHTDNHYGTPDMNGVVQFLAETYAYTFPDQRLRFNDMSLIQGGLFDVYGNNPASTWKPPHVSHRFGKDLDLGLAPRSQRDRLLRLVYFLGLSTPEGTNGDHLHVRLGLGR